MTWDTYALLATSNTRWGLKDIIPVALMIKQPSSFLTATNGNLKTWADVEREARKQTLKVAVTGFGSPDEITVNFFIARGLKLISVPFANPGERYTAVLGGHADLLYEQIGDVRSFVDSKQIQPVIVFADKRFSVFPDVPASTELGYDITLPQRRAVIMRHNAATIVEAIGIESIAASASLAPALVSTLLDEIAHDTERLPHTSDEIALDQALVCAAVHQAVARHCGTVATVYTAAGPAAVQYGKDLSSVDAVIGTGGALVHSRDPHAVLKMTLASSAEPLSLRPRKPRLLLDREYLLYACGLLASVEPQAALELALTHLEPIGETRHAGQRVDHPRSRCRRSRLWRAMGGGVYAHRSCHDHCAG